MRVAEEEARSAGKAAGQSGPANPARSSADDHGPDAHGSICSSCDRVIEPGEAARRRADNGEWMHEECPLADGGDNR